MAVQCFNSFFTRSYICAAIFLAFLNLSTAVRSEEVANDFTRTEHVIKPRAIRIYSKPPGEDWGKQTGRGLPHHIDNALQGGKIGVEFDLRKLRDRFSGFMESARKFLPFLNRFKKKAIDKPKDMPRNPPKVSAEILEPDSRDDKSNELDLEEEFSMEFELDPRRITGEPMDPEEIVYLEREKFRNGN